MTENRHTEKQTGWQGQKEDRAKNRYKREKRTAGKTKGRQRRPQKAERTE